MNRSSAWSVAEDSAKRAGIQTEEYKRVEGTYLPDKAHWCMTYEERGYGRTFGDQFAVLIKDSSGHAKVIRGVGSISVSRRAALEREIAKLPTKPAEQGGAR